MCCSLRCRRRGMPQASFVDESLFGNTKPGAPSASRSQVRNRGMERQPACEGYAHGNFIPFDVVNKRLERVWRGLALVSPVAPPRGKRGAGLWAACNTIADRGSTPYAAPPCRNNCSAACARPCVGGSTKPWWPALKEVNSTAAGRPGTGTVSNI